MQGYVKFDMPSMMNAVEGAIEQGAGGRVSSINSCLRSRPPCRAQLGPGDLRLDALIYLHSY